MHIANTGKSPGMQAELDRERGEMAQPQVDPVRTRSPLPSLVYLGVGIALSAVYVFLPQTAQNIAQNIAGASAVLAILIGIRRNRPQGTLTWLFMGLGL